MFSQAIPASVDVLVFAVMFAVGAFVCGPILARLPLAPWYRALCWTTGLTWLCATTWSESLVSFVAVALHGSALVVADRRPPLSAVAWTLVREASASFLVHAPWYVAFAAIGVGLALGMRLSPWRCRDGDRPA